MINRANGRLRAVAGRDATITLATNVALGAAGFLTAPILGRGLHTTGRGELSRIQAVPALVAGFGLLGLNEAVVFWGVRDPSRRRASLVGALRAAVSASLALALCTLVYLVHRGAGAAQLRYVAFIVLTPLIHIPYETLRAAGDYRRWNLMKALPSLVWLLAALGVAAGALHGPSQVADAYLIGLVAVVPFIMSAAFKITATGGHGVAGTRAADPAPTKHDMSRLLRYGSTVMLTGAPQAVNLRLDLAVVSETFSTARSGLYAAAVGWSALAGPVFATLASLALPRVAARGRREVPRVVIALVLVLVVTSVLAYPVTMLLFVRVFGADFGPGKRLAYLAVIAMCIWGANSVLAATLRGLGSLRLPLIGEMLGLVATLSLLGPSLHRFGLPGGQITSVVSYGLTTVVLGLGLWRTYRSRPASSMVIDSAAARGEL